MACTGRSYIYYVNESIESKQAISARTAACACVLSRVASVAKCSTEAAERWQVL